jgi:hypothetical protein
MQKKSAGARILEILLYTLPSLLLYHTGIGIMVFLIPLQIVATRRGIHGYLACAGAFLAVILGMRLYPWVASLGATPPDMLVLMELVTVVLLLLGLAAVNIPLRRRPRTLMLLLGTTVVAGIAAIPAAVLLSRSAAFQQSMDGLFAEVSRMLGSVFAASEDAVAGSLLSTLLEPSRLRQLSEAVVARSLLLDYFALLAFSWWAGQAAAARTGALFGVQPRFRFAEWKLQGFWLWPLIAAGALVLADLFFGLSFWAFGAWNAGLVVLFMFGLQGMAILRFIFEKHGIPRFLWLLLVAGVVLLAASPSAGLFVIIALPVFGVSENWIRYRVPRGPAPSEER